MANKYLIEDGSGHYQLEDGSGDLLLTYADVVLQDAPVGYWRLGESSGTVADDEVSTEDGTYIGSPTLGSTGALTGETVTAATFNGSSQYVRVTDRTSLDLGDTFTLEAWVKPTLGASMTVISKGIGAYQMRVLSDGTLALNQEGTLGIAFSTTFLVDGQWAHVVATKSGASVAVYINGVDRTNVIGSATFGNTNDPLGIGAANAGASDFFNGSIDDAAVYNYALTGAQVLNHYQIGTSTSGATDTNLTPSTATVTVTGQTPSVVIGTVLTPATASITVTGQTPTVNVDTNLAPPAASIVVTGQTPTVTLNTIVSPAAASIVITGQTPTVNVGTNIFPTTATVVVTTSTPTVSVSDNKAVTPAAATIVVTTSTPTVTLNTILTPAAASILVTGQTPTVTATANVNLTPTAALIVITGQTPTVTGGTVTGIGGTGGKFGPENRFGINSPEEGRRRRERALRERALLEETEPYLLDEEDAIVALMLADDD